MKSLQQQTGFLIIKGLLRPEKQGGYFNLEKQRKVLSTQNF